MRTLLKHAAILSLIASPSAFAEIVNSDLNIIGDGRTFTDTSTGLEFLDIKETAGISNEQIKSELDTTYLGWTFASAEQVTTMLTNLLSSTLGYKLDGVDYGEKTQQSFKSPNSGIPAELLSIVGGVDNYAYGIVEEDLFNLYGYRADSETQYETYFGWHYSFYTPSFTHYVYGTWMVRSYDLPVTGSNIQDVSAPLALSSLALLCFGLFRRQD
jgi:hypothetical protein